MKTDTPQPVYLKDYRPTDFVLETVALTFELGETETTVTSQLRFHRRPGAAADAPLHLDGDALTLVELAVDGEPVASERYQQSGPGLVISGLPAEAAFTLSVTTRINPTANTQLLGLYRTNGIYSTQCEAEGFRRITFFPDRPDVLAVYTVTIIGCKKTEPLLLSNGNLIEKKDLGDGRHMAVWNDPHPKPSYLFALVAGDLAVIEDHFVTASGRNVKLEIYVEHGKEGRAGYAMDSLKRSMRWDEERFGREYDLDIFMIVAVSDFNMGAMENKGLNVFNDRLILADPQTATDDDYERIEAVVAHEYFHNWTGNRITCRDWFQLSLKEGLTVYREHEFSADQRSRPVIRINEVRFLRSNQFPEDGGPLAHPVRPTQYLEIDNFYTTTVYEKGCEVSRMIATLIGRDGFRKGMDLYFERHDGGAVTIEDYLKCFEDATGRDLTQFSLWYHQAGTPVITATSQYDPSAKTLSLTLGQSIPPTPGQTDKKPMHIPIRTGLIGANGEEIEPVSVSGGERTGDVLHLTRASQTFVFEGIASKPAVSLNRDFSAPVRVSYDQPVAERALIARSETDPVARWDAANGLALQALCQMSRALQAEEAAEADETVARVLLAFAADETLEPDYRALALTLPSETDVARELGENVDPEAVHEARQILAAAIAKAGGTLFARLADEMRDTGAFSPDAASAGRRALRNIALSYQARISDDPEPLLAAYKQANSMTALIGALRILVSGFADTPAASEALADFRTRFAGEPLVLDKWFSAQAAIAGEEALERVKGLMRDAAFNSGNPNRVRALIGAFAASNPTGFNRADGLAYDFYADFLLDMDKRNPNLTARLMTSMRSFETLEPIRRARARSAIERIAEADGLSRNLRDIVNRMLKN
ncbi:aminopeptidase N [Martelella sp. HB161492]|uniref:aminopeptidase N n=1 Tax=Martelella sp. HB161492 TaxID=2720726 RepID=UPI00159086BE|nr:aminopeptidase N [Martelella sp. HB161492]